MSFLGPEDGRRSLGRAALVQSFFTADLLSLALFRVVLGALLVCDMLARIRDVEALYSNDGVLSNHFSLFRPLAPHQFSLFVGFSSARDVGFLFGLGIAVYVLFALGYRTRLFQVLSFICVTSAHSRNLMAELPGDVPLHLLLAWSLFLPLGARFSIDALRRSMASEHEQSPEELNAKLVRPRTVTSIAVLGILAQLAVIHLASAIHQQGDTWRDGSALYYVLQQGAWATRAGTWVLGHLPIATLRQLSSCYRWTEIVIGCLVLIPLVYARRLAAVSLLLFHLASRALFHVGLYDFVVLGALPLLITSRDWEAMGNLYRRAKPKLTVYFDADCGVCMAIVRVLRRLDVLERLTFMAGSSEESPPEVRAQAQDTVVVKHEASGAFYVKWRAVVAVIAALPLCGPLSWLLGALGPLGLADRAYTKFAQNRAAISVFFGYGACGLPHRESEGEKPLAPTPSPIGLLTRELGAALFLVLCGAALVRGTEDTPVATGLDGALQTAVAYPRIFQTWSLFAPDPPRRQGMVVVEGLTQQGHHVDPLTGQEPLVSIERAHARSLSPLMAAYFASVSQPSRWMYMDGLRDYVKLRGERFESGDKLSSFSVNWVEAEVAAPPGDLPAPANSGDLVLRKRLTSFP